MRYPSRRASLAAAALGSALIAGCAALQIDVDVYKGPLANSEEIERDQFIAMAMSAKALMYAMRNNLLDAYDARRKKKGEDPWDKDAGARSSVQLGNKFPCFDPRSDAERCPLDADLKSARQLNDILTHYEDRGDPAYSVPLAIIQSARRTQNKLVNKYLDGAANVQRADQETRPEFEAAHKERVKIWESLLEVLSISVRDSVRQSDPESADTARRIASEAIARVTQMNVLACAIDLAQTKLAGSPEGKWLLDARDRAHVSGGSGLVFDNWKWDPPRNDRARLAIERALYDRPVEGILALRAANWIVRTTDREKLCAQEKVPAATTSEKIHSRDFMTAQSREEGKGGNTNRTAKNDYVALPIYFSETGIVQQPPGKDTEDNALEAKFDELLNALAVLKATGFDHGRTDEGIDRLANTYAELQHQSLQSVGESGLGQNGAIKSRAEAAYLQLESAIVDLAARIQFLSINLGLLNDLGPAAREDSSAGLNIADPNGWQASQQTPIDPYKTLLESIANNLIVHGDDLRRKRLHDRSQTDFAEAERRSAASAFTLDAAAEFTDIELQVQDLRQAAQDAEGRNANLKNARKLEEEAKGKVEQATKEIEELLATIDGKRAGASAQQLSSLKADSEQILDQIKKIDGGPDLGKVYANLATWLEEQVKSALDERKDRLTKAERAFKQLTPPTPGGSKPDSPEKALDAVRQWIAQERENTEKRLAAKVDEAREAREILEQEQRAAAAKQGHTLLSSADYDATATLLVKLREPTLGRSTAAGVSPDARVVMGFLQLEIAENLKSKLDEGARAKYETAQSVLRSIVPSAAIRAPQTANSSSQVQKEVIAQLKYAVIDATRRFGAGHPSTRRAREALSVAQKAYEEEAYLRPASTYLRSVYSSTIAQDDPGLVYKNMLLSNLWAVREFDLASEPGGKKVRRARVELDKTYWQNINSVKLSASGGSNFVVAKDDVGNWYVKAMGSDPSAMIRAATQLALYNIGGTVDTNLLQVEELRAVIASKATTEAKDEARGQLKQLIGSSSGPAVAARSQTLTLFQQHYHSLSVGHLTELRRKFTSDAFYRAIAERWSATLKDADQGGEPLEGFKTRESVSSAYKAAKDSVDSKSAEELEAAKKPDATDSATGAAPEPGATDEAKTAAKVIIETLHALGKFRSVLRTAVASDAALIQKEQDTVESAEKEFEEEDKKLTSFNQELSKLIAEFAAQPTPPAAPAAPTQPQGGTAQSSEPSLKEKIAELNNKVQVQSEKVEKMKKARDAANAELALAKARRASAAQDVDEVINASISAVVEKRLQLLTETETAVKIVGQNNQ